MPALGALRALFSVVLEALFPMPAAERAVLAMMPEQAFEELPRARQFPINEACSIFSYKDERVRQLIWSLKYHKSYKAAEIAGFALHQILSQFARIAGPILVIPMPITKRRRRERGYNQCDLLVDVIERAEYAEERLNIASKISIRRDILIRVGHKSRQTLKDRTDRLESAHDIFSVNNVIVTGSKDLLSKYSLTIIIDDVVTTGSTIHDAIQTLRAAGFQNAFGLSIAH